MPAVLVPELQERQRLKVNFRLPHLKHRCPSRFLRPELERRQPHVAIAPELADLWRHQDIYHLDRPTDKLLRPLPKGKLDPDEGFVVGALREVLEETGCRARIESWAGETFYRVGERSKSVLFWNMLPLGSFHPRTQDPSEVAEVSFVAIDDALRMMTYPDERALVLGNSARSVTKT